jgi:enoyl-CoA hydratase
MNGGNSMQFTNILLEIESRIATVTFNRPKALNALNQETLLEALACFRELKNNDEVQVVILTGSGTKAFVAGADIAFMRELTPLTARNFAFLGQELMNTIEGLGKPVIAAVNGFALGGGCELAIACDMRLASDNAKFGQPEVNLGVIPGFAGTQRLPRIIGKGHASELIFTGDMIDAAEAYRIGLVNRVVSQDQLLPACRAIAARIISRGPVAVRLSKEAITNGMEMDLARACAYEADQFALCFASPDQKEGMEAFLEKRTPRFQGK